MGSGVVDGKLQPFHDLEEDALFVQSDVAELFKVINFGSDCFRIIGVHDDYKVTRSIRIS